MLHMLSAKEDDPGFWYTMYDETLPTEWLTGKECDISFFSFDIVDSLIPELVKNSSRICVSEESAWDVTYTISSSSLVWRASVCLFAFI